jgi:hypothetical protein
MKVMQLAECRSWINVIAILGLIIWALFYEIGKAPWQFITI